MSIISLILIISLIIAGLSLVAVIAGFVFDNEALTLCSAWVLDAALLFPVFYGLVWLGDMIVKGLNG